MLANAISRSVSQVFSAPFRAVLWKSIGLTIVLLIGLWFVLEALISTFLMPFLGPWPWVATALAWILGGGLLIAMGFLIAPVTSLFAGVFLDEVAEAVERTHYPKDPVGTPLALRQSVMIALRFFGLVILGNLAALILVLFFGLGVPVFFVVNGYLLGREYFQFAALRHVSVAQADAIRLQNGTPIFLGGLAIAALLAVPIVNLLTPLFAGALMTHVYKALAARSSVAA
ncbi:sulfate transporter family protein [Pseudahrensia aquimaris]|uniref:Sulfate transporter family protein n=1 Tax=Pseudahrensia aquimaris TaxID=744461 RepID=A0ABW3FIZ1_9HYPH